MSIVLHYFNIYARGEPIRVILHYAGLEFEDRFYAREDFPSISSQFEFEELPCLEIDGLRLVQSHSIERYLCQRLGYCFKDPYLNYLTSSLVDVREDFTKKKIQLVWYDKNNEGWIEWVRNEFAVILRAIEKRYVNNGETGFFVGNSPSIGDFEMFVFLHDQFMREQVREIMLPILRGNAPKLIQFVESFKNSSETLKEYMDSRVARPF